MIKECPLCGKEFEANVTIRKYCFECSKLSDRQKIYAKENIEKAQDKYDALLWKPKIFEGDCELCGKHLKKEYKYVWKRRPDLNGPLHFFCSKECMLEYEKNYVEGK